MKEKHYYHLWLEKSLAYLSREKRTEIDLFKDYFEMYNPSEYESFYYSTKYRCYFNSDVYPVWKLDQSIFFKDKDYYPETHIENPMADGIWYVKPSKGYHGRGIIITDDVRSVNMEDAVYQKCIENPLLKDGRKLDIRIFVVLHTYKKYFRSYIYSEVPERLSPLPYNKNDFSKPAQLTNHDLYWENIEPQFRGIPKYSSEIMESGLGQFTKHKYFKELYIQAKDIVIDFSNNIYNKMNNNNQRNLIHIFAFDLLPDKNKKLWLLETNSNPGPTTVDHSRLFNTFTSFPKRITEDLLDELIYPMGEDRDINLNKFNMVFEKPLTFNRWVNI